jgi:hypothetical protein
LRAGDPSSCVEGLGIGSCVEDEGVSFRSTCANVAERKTGFSPGQGVGSAFKAQRGRSSLTKTYPTSSSLTKTYPTSSSLTKTYPTSSSIPSGDARGNAFTQESAIPCRSTFQARQPATNSPRC